jgi:hypothetical protein
LLLLFLALMARAESRAADAILAGADPFAVLTAAWLGDPGTHEPGIVGTLRAALADAHASGYRLAAGFAGVDVPPDAPEGSAGRFLPLYAGVARASARQMLTTLVGRVRPAVDAAAGEGAEARAAAFREAMEAGGYTAGNSQAMSLAASVNVVGGYDAGYMEAFRRPDIAAKLWGWKYVTQRDNRVRPNHREMDGVTRPKADPVWRAWVPPCGFNCRCILLPRFVSQRNEPTEDLPDVLPDPGWGGEDFPFPPID